MTKEINLELDTTTFINIDNEPFDIYIGGRLVRHFKPKEEDKIVVYVAQVGGKHLVDRILQKQGIHSLTDSVLRKDLFAKILPELAEIKEVKPLSQEEAQAQLEEELKKQRGQIDEVLGKLEEKNKKDEQIAELMKKVAELEKAVAKGSKKADTSAQ